MTNTGTIHRYAQRTHNTGRNTGGTIFFESDGKKLYSYGYHYLLCEFIDNNTVMINDRGYSNSTAKHISITIGATRQYKQFYKTRTDLDTVHNTVIANKNKLATARKPELYVSPILSLWASLNHFLEYTKAKKYKSNPKYREIKKIVENVNKPEYQELLRNQAIKRKKAKAIKDAKDLKVKLTKFKNFELNWFRIGNEDYLRLSKCGEFVETSQGSKVTTENAKILYKMILNNINIKGHRIDGFTVTSINGVLKIGCHNINIESMHKVGKQLI